MKKEIKLFLDCPLDLKNEMTCPECKKNLEYPFECSRCNKQLVFYLKKEYGKRKKLD